MYSTFLYNEWYQSLIHVSLVNPSCGLKFIPIEALLSPFVGAFIVLYIA